MTAAEKVAFLPVDRAIALAENTDLPEHTSGTVVSVDVSGFTAMTEALRRLLGDRRGADELTRRLNTYYEALIAEVHGQGGSVIGFSGDGITCWFDSTRLGGSEQAVYAAATAAFRARQVIRQLKREPLPDGTEIVVAVKVSLATGNVRRFVVGDPAVQLIDVLAGATLARGAMADGLANPDEIVTDSATADLLAGHVQVREWRNDDQSGERFAVMESLSIEPTPWKDESNISLPDEIAAQWVIPAINTQLDAGLGEMRAELRPAVAVFMRFTGIDYDSDANAGAKLDHFFRWAQGTVTRYGGNVIQLTIGDKGSYLYAAFGAPVAREDDIYRAVSAALILSQPPADMPLQIQIGISRGIMRTGTYGSPKRHTYGVLGDEVNLAARLMSRAAVGAVLVSSRVRRQVETHFAFADQTMLSVKGKSEPTSASRLGRRHDTAEIAAVQVAPPMIGRGLELSQLLLWSQPILERKFAGLIDITGEAGIGKSRLVNELRQQLIQRHDVRWLSATADEMLQVSLQPFVAFMRAYFNQRHDEAPKINQANFNQKYDQLLDNLTTSGAKDQGLRSELERTRSFLAALIGLHSPDSLYALLSPDLRFSNTLTALRNLFLAESQRQPLVLHIENSQKNTGK